MRVLSLLIQQIRSKKLKVSFTEVSMTTSDSKSTILHLYYTAYLLQSFQMLTNTQKTSVHWLFGVVVMIPVSHQRDPGSIPRMSRLFCYFFLYKETLPLPFPCLPKGIFPFPSNLRQPQLSSFGKCKEQPSIPF